MCLCVLHECLPRQFCVNLTLGFFSLSCISCSFSFKLGHRAKRCLFGSFFVKESDECAADALDTPHGAAPNSTC